MKSVFIRMEENKTKGFPFEVEDVDPKVHPELQNYLLEGYKQGFLRIGPKKYFLHKQFMEEADNIYNFPLRSDDIFVVTFPKSGTTLTQELVWLINNSLDYEKAQSMFLTERFPFLEFSTLAPLEFLKFKNEQTSAVKDLLLPVDVKGINEIPSPRFIKSHLPLSLLPPSLLEERKVVYVARDPRDAAVSFYHHHMLMKTFTPDKQFKPFWELLVSDNMIYGPYFEHILEGWELRNHPNMLFLFYEEMTKDIPGTIKRVANFFGKTITDEEVNKLADHLKIDNFRKNKSVNFENMQESGVFTSEGGFIRKGKSGTWRESFDEEMIVQAEEWIAKNLSNTDFRFPHC